MRRLKLQHQYHDAVVRSVEYPNSEDISLKVELAEAGKPGVHLTFTGVRNFIEVRKMLEAARFENSSKELIAEIVGIARHEERGYVLDLGTPKGIRVDSKGLLET